MTVLAPSLLGRRTWRRLERNATRGHERYLLDTLRELSAARPPVLGATGSWMPGALSLQLAGRRLLLGGVAPSAVWSALAMAHSPTPMSLIRGSRYGKLWWVTVAGDEEQLVLATHLQLLNDPGRPPRAKVDLPVLSGAY